MAQLPTGTVTFLFSDIEGSTRLWEEFPDAMQECLAHHDEILRHAVRAHDGIVVKTTGDGVHAAFATAAGGVAAAIDAEAAAVFIGALERGTLAELSNYGDVRTGSRAHAFERIVAILGEGATRASVDRGAMMSYEELASYALEHLGPPAPDR